MVERLDLEGFTVFEDASFDLVPGINVLIGDNGTGKTHLMKVLYTVLRAFEEPRRAKDAAVAIEYKMAGVFGPDEDRVSRLVRRVRGKGVGEITARIDGRRYGFSLHQTVNDPIRHVRGTRGPTTPSSIFLPSREILGIYEGLASLYAEREINVDETYVDAVRALDLPPLRGTRPGALGAAARELEDSIGARVRKIGPRFYLTETKTKARVEANLAAEGHRKIASLLVLISNGALRDRAVLFWDEPEANLNPILSETVVDAIASLAKGGVQIILATHDYLIADRLSLLAETSANAAPVRFFGMQRGPTGAAVADTADRLSDLNRNLLFEAVREHGQYQRRAKLRTTNKR